MNSFSTIDEYLASFPVETQQKLQLVRECIQEIVPEAKECINYGIPTFKLKKNLVHFAGYKHHIGFYPGSATLAAFKAEIAANKSAKGSVQFPLNLPLPLELIREMVKYRVQLMLAKSK